jgi:zinc protease
MAARVNRTLRRARPAAIALSALCFAIALIVGDAPALAQKHHGKKPKVEKKGKVEKKPSSRKAGAKKPKAKGHAAAAKEPAAPSRGPRRAAREHAKPTELKVPVQRVKLANGLRVVLNVDHTSPTVAVAVTYDVGSRDEERGRSGFAHLFEHMMFQGSRNIAKGEHFRLVAAHGGTLNGTTSADRTNYYEVLPASELALGLWLEADRMRSLDVSQANFENQRKVVQEEYRMRVGNAPYRTSAIRLEELVYQGYWPYEHSTIGSMADLDGAQLSWVRAFHASHYGPNNAVLSIAGDVEPNEALGLVHKYFDGIPMVTASTFADAELPEQTSQRTAIVKDDHARTPSVRIGFPIPSGRDPERYALTLAGIILADGESSRLHQLMVRDKAIAQRVSASASSRRGPGIFHVDAVLVDGAKPEDAERLVENEIKQLATRGPSDKEVDKALRQVEAGYVLGLQSNLARAKILGEYELFWGDGALVAGELDRYFAIGRDDIKRAVDKYLGPTRRTIVETVPRERAVDAHAKGAADAPKKAHAKHEEHAKKAEEPKGHKHPSKKKAPAKKAAGKAKKKKR